MNISLTTEIEWAIIPLEEKQRVPEYTSGTIADFYDLLEEHPIESLALGSLRIDGSVVQYDKYSLYKLYTGESENLHLINGVLLPPEICNHPDFDEAGVASSWAYCHYLFGQVWYPAFLVKKVRDGIFHIQWEMPFGNRNLEGIEVYTSEENVRW